MQGIAEAHAFAQVVVREAVHGAGLVASEHGVEHIDAVALQKRIHESYAQRAAVEKRDMPGKVEALAQPFQSTHANAFIGE